MPKGTIGVTTENIFPIIKKFLYSEHEIFLREMVSNAIDATQKLKTFASKGDFKGEIGDTTVKVILDKDKGTLTIKDRGIGMTEEEINKYINQIAFSGVNDYLEKYKDDANSIIGHFGLGFYSSFMVSKKVEIITKSHKEGSKAIKWSCDGSPSFEISEAEKEDRGSDIILYIDDDCKEFLETARIQELLTRYCRFLPIPIAFGKETEWKDGKQVDTEKDNIINDTEPLWTKKPVDLKDEDYKAFYHKLYPTSDDPMFWIHLNVDYPFNLTGILYFPKIKSNLDVQRNKIQLYCNQVYVTDHIENIIPEFLTLLHGVIDSPDIPLNVSRSYLQSDASVRKISAYITKKVCDKLLSIFKNERKDFENKWDDLKLFINYGMLSDEKFYDKAKDFSLFKDTEGKYYTFDEYKTLVKENQTDKDDNLVYLYTNDKEAQYSFIEAAQSKGYNVLEMNGQLDSPIISKLEQKLEKTHFSRVDGDIVEKLIPKKEEKIVSLSEEEKDNLSGIFTSQLPKIEKIEFNVQTESMGENGAPVVITQSEYMRRMKEMSQIQQGMSFYGEMPNIYSIVLNADNPIIKEVLKDGESHTKEKLSPIEGELKGLKARHAALQQAQTAKKPEEVTKEEKDKLAECDKDVEAQKNKKKSILAEYGSNNKTVKQLIDLALLQNNLLKGQALNNFIKRSYTLIK